MVPTSIFLVASTAVFRREESRGSLIQLMGAGCLVIVVLTHIFEAVGLLPWMHWGQERSLGHYIDFWSAVLGLTLVPAGFLMRRLRKGHVSS